MQTEFLTRLSVLAVCAHHVNVFGKFVVVSVRVVTLAVCKRSAALASFPLADHELRYVSVVSERD